MSRTHSRRRACGFMNELRVKMIWRSVRPRATSGQQWFQSSTEQAVPFLLQPQRWERSLCRTVEHFLLPVQDCVGAARSARLGAAVVLWPSSRSQFAYQVLAGAPFSTGPTHGGCSLEPCRKRIGCSAHGHGFCGLYNACRGRSRCFVLASPTARLVANLTS